MTREAAATGEVDVVIPTYDNRDGVLECLGHITDAAVAERIVVDDVSSDGTAEAVRTTFPEVTLLELEVHQGVPHAVNAGAAMGSSPYVLLLNDDVLPDEGSVTRLVAELKRNPEATSAAGRLVDSRTGETQAGYLPRHFPTLGTMLVRLLGIERLKPDNRWSGQHLREPLPEDGVAKVTQQPAGACHLVRRELFEELGGWDPDYWFMYEDGDFGARLARYGEVVWVGPATFRHLGGRNASGWPRHRFHARLHHGMLRYAQVHFSRLRAGVVAATMIAVSLPRLLASIHRNPPAARTYRSLIVAACGVLRGRPVELRIPAEEARRRERTAPTASTMTQV